jgi:hypothetical protein
MILTLFLRMILTLFLLLRPWLTTVTADSHDQSWLVGAAPS